MDGWVQSHTHGCEHRCYHELGLTSHQSQVSTEVRSARLPEWDAHPGSPTGIIERTVRGWRGLFVFLFFFFEQLPQNHKNSSPVPETKKLLFILPHVLLRDRSCLSQVSLQSSRQRPEGSGVCLGPACSPQPMRPLLAKSTEAGHVLRKETLLWLKDEACLREQGRG